MWNVINSGPEDAKTLMERDKDFLETLKIPTLHFYRFKNPSVTYGCLMKLGEHLDLSALQKHHIEAAVRPTGGGALFHLWDLAFSVIIPLEYIPHITNTLDRYHFINEQVEVALKPFMPEATPHFLTEPAKQGAGERFCMAKPTLFDLMVGEKKCVGAAQRVTRRALLHQGTIALCPPDLELLKEVLIDKELVEKMESLSFCLSNFSYQDRLSLTQLQDRIEASLLETFNKKPLELHE